MCRPIERAEKIATLPTVAEHTENNRPEREFSLTASP